MTGTKSFGRKRDGSLTECHAAPENQGKGNCHHFFHFDLATDKIEETIRNDKEKQLERNYKHFEILNKKQIDKENKENVQQEKLKAFQQRMPEVEKLTKTYIQKNLSFLNQFSKEFYETIIRANKNKEGYWGNAIHEFLQSDNETVLKIRDHLGEEADLKSLSEILVNPPFSMMGEHKFKNVGKSVSRIVLSMIDNNMDRNNYLTTVIYFGGKCSYCGLTLNNNKNSQNRATGDHLTPIAPLSKETIRGSTRFGNMALACSKCNVAKGSQECEEWIITTDVLNDSQKIDSLAKIRAFRQFANYKKFNNNFNNKINEGIQKIEKIDQQKIAEKDKTYRYSTERRKEMSELIKSFAEELQEITNKYDD